MTEAANDTTLPHPTITALVPTRTIGLLADEGDIELSLLEKLRASEQYILVGCAFQRRLDKLANYKGERNKVFNAEVRRTAKAWKEHVRGEAAERFKAADADVRRGLLTDTVDKTAVQVVLTYTETMRRMWDACEAAVKAKKDEQIRLNDKIASVEAALRRHMRMGPGGRDLDEEPSQTTIPGTDEAQPAAEQWMDAATRQVTLDTLTSELRVIDRDLEAARTSENLKAQRLAEDAKRAYSEILGSLQAAGVFGDFIADDEDLSFVAPEPVDDDDPDVVLGEMATGASDTFALRPDGPPAGLEDPTQHPALQGAIKAAKTKRQAKKAAKAGGDGGAKKTGKRGGKRGK